MFATISPLVFAFCLWLLYMFRTRVLEAHRERCREQTILVLLLMVFLLLPSICTRIFQGIPCAYASAKCVITGDERVSKTGDSNFGVDGASFLRSDYSVSCTSNEFKIITMYVFLSIAIYPVGVHLLEFTLLRAYRADIVQRTGRAQHLSCLYEAFTPTCFYWECLDSIRRISLTGFLVFFDPMRRVTIALLIALGSQV